METWRLQAKQIQWWPPSLIDYAQTRWTSFYDVGKEINGAIFSYEDYFLVENKFIELITFSLKDQSLVDYNYLSLEINTEPSELNADQECFELLTVLSTHPPSKLDFCLLKSFVQLLLREHIWCAFLGNENIKFRFGYDYYIYVDGAITQNIERKIHALGLFLN